MKKAYLSKISEGKYHVDNCCTYKGKTQICNFYITELSKNRIGEKITSFTITLRRKLKAEELVDQANENITTEESTATLPLYYLYDPKGWLYHGFDTNDFTPTCRMDNYCDHINEIIKLIENNNLILTDEYVIGWIGGHATPNKAPIGYKEIFNFGKIDDPSDIMIPEKLIQPEDYIKTYMELLDHKISAPIISYTLLSLLSSFDIPGHNIRADFMMAITGSTEVNRRKLALFLANLFKRNSNFYSNSYQSFHIMKSDSFSEMQFKAEYVKDCVLIAFEPDKKHLNHIINKIYYCNEINEDKPIRNMCLITANDLKGIKGNIMNIRLSKDFSFESVQKYFTIEYCDYLKDDYLMKSIYYYISCLLCKLQSKKKIYIKNKFDEYKKAFDEKYNITAFSEKAYETALFLSFALYLYNKVYYKETKESPAIKKHYAEAMKHIVETAKNSFPLYGTSTDMDFEEAKIICDSIDSYFDSNKKIKRAGEIGNEQNIEDIRLWYNDEYFYITANNISEILKLKDCTFNFAKRHKLALSDNELIHVYNKPGGGVEYSVHILTPLYNEHKSKSRFIAFKRKNLEKYDLFKNIKKFILLNEKIKSLKASQKNLISKHK